MKQRHHARPFAGLRHHDVIFRHGHPILVPIERLGHDDDPALGFPVIERIGAIVHRITESIEIAPVGQRSGETEAICGLVFVNEISQRCQRLLRGSSGSSIPAPIIARKIASESVVPFRDG